MLSRFVSLLLVLAALPLAVAESATPGLDLASLGRALFFDPRLSNDRSMSCASCHDAARAFTDGRDNGVGGAASLGNDGESLGDRNAPMLTYASLVPGFAKRDDGSYAGGLFHDGRARDLVAQASQPITSAKEMALPSAAVVRERVRENPAYVDAFNAELGDDALATPDRALASVAEAIAAFESSAEFSTFDSRYDRYLRGEVTLTREEELGRILFFSPLSNCSRCHLIDQRENSEREIFSNFEYHNIGVPPNRRLRLANGSAQGHVDQGLLGNPGVTAAEHRGKVRVPSLRNVAITAPYMHNGVFAELKTAIVFYNRFLVDSPASRTNPETSEPWGDAEVPATVARDLLAQGQPLSEQRVGQIEAFLKTLTDQRYEHLLER